MTTHCRRGHPWTDANTRWLVSSLTGKPFRQCKLCKRIKEKLRYRHDEAFRNKQKAKALDRSYRRKENQHADVR